MLDLAAAVILTALAQSLEGSGPVRIDLDEPGTQRFETAGATVDVMVRASVYLWSVTNTGDTPIMAFEVPRHNTYNASGPVGWSIEEEGEVFRSWTDDPAAAIAPGALASFRLRVTSNGAILGTAPLTLTLADGGTITVPDVWAPRAMSSSMMLFVPLALVGLAGGHALVLARRRRRSAPSAP